MIQEPPTFLAENRELWRAWGEIQMRGRGEAEGRGWKIESEELEDGRSAMRLSIYFTREHYAGDEARP